MSGLAPPNNSSALGDAQALESRLLAPCCWTQTLDIHESDSAQALREEIAQRLESGESSDAIEDDLASRYGDRIRAVPRGRDPRSWLAVFVGFAMLLSLLGVAVLLRRWARRSRRVAQSTNKEAERNVPDAYDARIDDELARLDGV
ncbi:MAG: cytochrome c-type biogenesis protein CcmH [Polyangiaceae bacterium]